MDAVPITNCAYCGGGVNILNSAFCCQACEALAGKFTHLETCEQNQFSYLDQPNFKNKYKHEMASFDYQLYVEGLHCASCIHLLEKIPDFDPSILLARVDYSQSRLGLKVSVDFSLARTATLLDSWGYKPHFLENTQETESIRIKENKSLLKKIAVTGACAGNIMLFVIPVYSGLEGEWKNIFNWMSFVLFLPILLYSGTTFYKGAWNSLRYKVVNVDLPIAIALVSGFLLSTVNLIQGHGLIYFDSTASFIFLILSARYFLKKNQQNFSNAIQVQDFLKCDHFIKVVGTDELIVGLNEIKDGDVIKLKYNQISPVDGRIIDSAALFDVAVLNGESMPRRFEIDMNIIAGSKLLSETVEIQVTAEPSKTHLVSLLKELQDGSWKKSNFVALTDKYAQGLIVTVFVLAILFFIFYSQFDSQEAFQRSLALIVLACPCALAFGSPLALSLALKEAQRRGILIKTSNVFEKILSLKHIFFDKTGTLTEIELTLKSTVPLDLDQKIKTIIVSLEQQSYHPIAFAVRNAWPEIKSLKMSEWREELGHGVSGSLGDNLYELIQHEKSESENDFTIVLKENGKFLCQLMFEAPIYKECPHSIQELQKSGHTCFLISGDKSKLVPEIALACHIPLDRAFGNLGPEQKKHIVQSYRNTCMIGDGSNDSLALQAADIGIAVKGSTYLSLKAADIYFTRSGLTPLLELFKLAQKTQRTLVRNLSFSLAYNLIGGTLALLGFVNPWLAAILMPISSFIIIASTLWGFR